MNIKIKKKRGITLISLLVTIILLLILAGVSITMLTGENGLLLTAQRAKIKSQKADYRETIELSKVEEGINKNLNRTKKEKLEGIYNILRNGEKFKKDVDDNKASMELIDNDELEPRIVIITKEGWKYTVTVDGIIEGEILPIDLEKANIKIQVIPSSWTNKDVEVKIEIQNEEYKENKIQYSYDLKTWRDYKDTGKIKITENKAIYARLANGLSTSDKYATGNITNIDTLEPNTFTPTATSTTKSIIVTVNATDADATETSGSSGIAGYRFKLDSGSWTEYQTSGTYTWDNLTQTTNHTITVEVKDNAGNIKQETVTKGTETIETAGKASYTPTGWTNGDVTVTLPQKDGFITRYTTNGTMPTTSSTAYSNSFTVSSNCTITYIYTDGVNIGGAGTLNIENIDKDNPNQFVPKIESTTITSLKVTGNTTDDGSGIKKYYYSKDNGTNWVTNDTNSYTFENLTSGQTYKIKMKAVDNVENETITETIEKYPGYIKEGLVLQYDGINNTGAGHSTTTNVWKDISGNGNDIKLNNFNYDSNSGWTNDALVFDGLDDYATRTNPLYSEDSKNLQNVTVEVISQSKEYANVRYGAIIDMGSTTNVNEVLNLWNAYNDGTGRNYCLYSYVNSLEKNALSYEIPISTLKHNTLNAISFGIKEGKKSFGYLNSKNILDNFTGEGEVQPKWFTNILLLGRDWRAYYGDGTGDLSGQEGNNYFYGYLKSVRIYNRVLSADEVSYNYKFDNQRYKID